jgi:hypothetical protein
MFLSSPMSKFIHQLKLLPTFAGLSSSPRSCRPLSTRITLFFRSLILGLLFTYNSYFFLTLNSCGLDVEDPTPPSPPVWIQKSLPEEWPERGIDAHESGGIYLEWEPNPEEDILAYLIYRAEGDDMNDSIGPFELITRLELESMGACEYIDSHAPIGITLHYKLRAKDESENISSYSNSAQYYLLAQPGLQFMFPNSQSHQLYTTRQLIWRYQYSIEMEDYCITILSELGELVLRQILVPSDYTSWNESWYIPMEIMFESGALYRWRIDTGAHYLDGYEMAGSESPWATFFYFSE